MNERRDEADTGRRDERDPQATREAEDAHGGSMAPGLVDDTGHPVGEAPVEPSVLGTPGEDGTGS